MSRLFFLCQMLIIQAEICIVHRTPITHEWICIIYAVLYGRPAAVLVSPDEFEGWRETIAIKFDEDLMTEIKKGISALKEKTSVYTLEKLKDN